MWGVQLLRMCVRFSRGVGGSPGLPVSSCRCPEGQSPMCWLSLLLKGTLRVFISYRCLCGNAYRNRDGCIRMDTGMDTCVYPCVGTCQVGVFSALFLPTVSNIL